MLINYIDINSKDICYLFLFLNYLRIFESTLDYT